MVSSSHACRGLVNAQAALLMAREMLRYRLADEGYDAWLGRITELSTPPVSPQRPPTHSTAALPGG